MKLEIKANDFCPDNCPYCEPEKDGEIYCGDEKYVTWYCRYRNECKHANTLKGCDGK